MKRAWKKLFTGIIWAWFLFCMPLEATYAASECSVIEHCITNEGVFFYVKGINGGIEEVHCKIGEDSQELISVSLVEESKIYTLIIWDTSVSNVENERKRQKDVLTDLIANRAPEEYFCVVAVGEKLSYITEWTQDYIILKRAINGLNSGMEGETEIPLIVDAIEDLNDVQEKCFKRVVWVTDYGTKPMDPTMEEALVASLDETRIPMYILVDKVEEKSSEGEQDKNGFVDNLWGLETEIVIVEKDPLEIAEYFEKDYYALEIEMEFPKESYIEGAQQIVLEIHTTRDDYIAECIVDFSNEEAFRTGRETFLGVKNRELLLIGVVSIGVIIIGIGITFLILYLKKKKKTYRASLASEQRIVNPNAESFRDESKSTKVHRLKLTNRMDSVRMYQCDFKGNVIIGRNPNMCTLLICGDNSVSGRHCEIYESQGLFYIKDLNSSNGTRVNGIPFSGKFEIHTGDIVKLGRVEYIVEIE